MADVVLFHHILGLTDGVVAFAERLREGGHDVVTPDLFEGRTFGSIADGADYAEGVGFELLLDRATTAAAELPASVVYAGFSLGALAANRSAQTRPGAGGALLYHHGDVPLGMFGDDWPDGVPLQIHLTEGDAFREEGVAEAFVDRASGVAVADLYLYPGSAHLFTDSSLDEFDAASTDLVVERSLELLQGA